MPLFKIQDEDRPLYIVAKDFGTAEKIWEKIIAHENGLEIEEVSPPLAIQFICPDVQLVKDPQDWESHCIS